MSSLGMGIYEKGIQEGIQIGRDRAQKKIYTNQLYNLYTKKHLAFEEAADLLLIPEEEHEKYRALLEQKLSAGS